MRGEWVGEEGDAVVGALGGDRKKRRKKKEGGLANGWQMWYKNTWPIGARSFFDNRIVEAAYMKRAKDSHRRIPLRGAEE